MNLSITVEGVESKEELLKLNNKNIKYIQGWYFSKALPFEEVKTFSDEFILDI
jgi:EAL domain-containing protein (putative c-di-GMP-specific phosphodiesterase class I)